MQLETRFHLLVIQVAILTRKRNEIYLETA